MKKYILILLTFATLSACTEEIDLNLDVLSPKPVISGVLSPVEQWVELSTSSAYLKDDSKYPVSSALVSVAVEGTTYQLTEQPDQKGVYKPQGSIPIMEGKEYKLTVQGDFGRNGSLETFTSSCVVPRTPVLDSVNLVPLNYPGSAETLFFVMLSFQDWAGEDFYFTKTHINGMLEQGLNSYGLQDNPRNDGIYVRKRIAAVLSKRPNSEDALEPGDIIRIDFSAVAKQYYNFLYGAKEEISGGSPLFSGPPANIVGNISNGALGVFTAYTAQTIEIELRF